MAHVPPPDVRLVLPAVPESAGVARHIIAGMLPPDLDPRRRELLLVAVSEVVTNAVLHAHHDARPAKLEVTGAVVDRVLSLTFIDPGRGMLPDPEERVPGVGLSIAAAAADTLEVRGGNELRLTFGL